MNTNRTYVCVPVIRRCNKRGVMEVNVYPPDNTTYNMTSVSSNNNNSVVTNSQPDLGPPLYVYIYVTTINALVFFVGVIGNALVIQVRCLLFFYCLVFSLSHLSLSFSQLSLTLSRLSLVFLSSFFRLYLITLSSFHFFSTFTHSSLVVFRLSFIFLFTQVS